MSGSAKKKLVQKTLPFAIFGVKASASSPQLPDQNSSPNILPASRKRKPSGDADGAKSKKRVNVDPKDVVEIRDSVDEAPDEDPGEQSSATLAKGSEVTPTTAASESVLHIKLPSCSKSKRKGNMDAKPLQKSLSEEDSDDSVVYLDKEEVRKSVKKCKSAKKSEKKNKKKASPVVGRVRKALDMSEATEEQVSDKGSPGTSEDSTKNSDDNPMEVDGDLVEEHSEVVIDPAILKVADKAEEQKIETIPSKASSPEDLDAIHDEIIEMLSDNSQSSPQNNSTKLNSDSVVKTPTNKIDVKNLTPKQLARRQELETRRMEKELLRQKERELKEQQRLKEKEMREEAKRKEKEEKEEVKQKEKEERDKKRQEEQDKKDEEKRIKEEERKRIADQREEEKRQKDEEKKRQAEQREEEKRKLEEEKRKLEDAKKKKEQEEEIRKKKAAEAFSKFFVTKKKTEATTADDDTSKDSAESAESIAKAGFMPFQVRQTTKVAPLVRLQIGIERQMKLDEGLKTVMAREELYLNVLKSALYKPGKTGKTWPADDKDDDVVLIDELEGIGEDIQMDESKTKMKHRAKFLKFKENRRPAFHGTWRKKSAHITARRPFAQDQIFDYEVESDDEWEEEEPGESLHGTDSEKEKDKDGEESDYEIDNDFMVPHGHLSDEEMQQNDDEEMRDNHPEAQKAKLKILQQEFAAEMKKKTEKIKPRLIGCIWMNGDEDENGCSMAEKKYHCSDIIWRILKAREMMTREDGVKLEENLEPEVLEVEEEPAAPAKIQVRQKFNDVSVKEFIRLLHGNTNNKKFLIKEFQAYRLKNYHKEPDFLEFFVKSVEEKMTEIVEYKTCAEEGSLFGKKCWLVKPDVLSEHFPGDELKLPNEWTYILEKEVNEKKPKQPQQPAEEAPEHISTVATSKIKVDVKPKEAQNPTTASASPVIVKKSASPAVVKKSASPSPNIFKKSALPSPVVIKKRVQLLVSGPRGQEIPQTKKNNSISQYLKGIPKEVTGTSKAADAVPQEAASSKPIGDDEVVVID